MSMETRWVPQVGIRGVEGRDGRGGWRVGMMRAGLDSLPVEKKSCDYFCSKYCT